MLQALLDLDGTVADYDTALRRDLLAISSPGELDELQQIISTGGRDNPDWFEARRSLITRQPGWWVNLPRIELGFEIVRALREYDFQIDVLTQGPSTKPQAWAEKVQWCAKHLPEVDVTITRNKALAYGRILVDDWPPFMNAWLKHRPRGLGIVPARRWNEDFKHPNIFRYDGTNYTMLRKAIHRAAYRMEGEPLDLEEFLNA